MGGVGGRRPFSKGPFPPPSLQLSDILRVFYLRFQIRFTEFCAKDRAIRDRQIKKIDEALARLKCSTEKEKRALRKRSTAERRVGRLFERHSRGARFFEVEISEHSDPSDPKRPRLNVKIKRRDDIDEWADLSDGCYLLRTNMTESDPEFLWQTYIGLTQVEQSFRIEKSDLGLRPIYHHTEQRAQAHIMICFLSLVMWRALELWMDAAGLGTCPRKLVAEMDEVRSMDIVLPVKQGRELRLRVVGRPEKRLVDLLSRLDLPLPNCPKTILNVVPKMALREP